MIVIKGSDSCVLSLLSLATTRTRTRRIPGMVSLIIFKTRRKISNIDASSLSWSYSSPCYRCHHGCRYREGIREALFCPPTIHNTFAPTRVMEQSLHRCRCRCRCRCCYRTEYRNVSCVVCRVSCVVCRVSCLLSPSKKITSQSIRNQIMHYNCCR
jgi:hypothetical protein